MEEKRLNVLVSTSLRLDRVNRAAIMHLVIFPGVP